MGDLLDNNLFEAFANASDNIFIYVTDMQSGMTRWSKKAVDFFGFEQEYLDNTYEVWLDHVHPEDREVYLADIDAVLAGNASQHNCQYRARNKYGEYVWVECRGSIMKNEAGEITVFAGLMTWLDNQNKYDSLTHLLTGYELLRYPFSDNGCLMIIGVDNFRNINSQHGLSYGNSILVHLADILTSNLNSDATVYRFHGDEFVVCSKNCAIADMTDFFTKVKNICLKSETEHELVNFSISAGLVSFLEGDDPATMLGKAVLSLAHAKNNSSSGLTVYSSEIERKQSRKNVVSEALLHSIKHDFAGFYLVFQPILSNEGNTIVGCESLLRWKSSNEEVGACYPDEFISILEKNGGIIDVGYFVMKEAIRQASVWQKKYKKFSVSFNISYLQLEDPNFVPTIIDTINEYNIDPNYIIIELTESVLAADTVMVKRSFEQLKKCGVKIALDDFGTGNSSFWTLHNIDIDIVKLDQSFIRGLDNSGAGIDYAIVESVGLMCNRIGYMTVAEGVENENIWKMISKFGFSGLQGYLFSRPIEVVDFESTLAKYDMLLA